MAQQRHIGRYEILEELGVGGQATVFRARDPRLDRIVALKVLHPHLAYDSQLRERFLREARLAARITHTNVTTIYDVDEEKETRQPYIAMEYLPRSLHGLLEERGALSVGEAVELARQVASALDAAHEKDIVHRDIKPRNILLAHDGSAKVTDFGIARALDLPSLTSTGLVIGTPHFMSPEQTISGGVDIRSLHFPVGFNKVKPS